jgi:hypothetical protein
MPASIPARDGFAARRNHPLYRRWVSMLHRCRNPKAKDYGRYGGRGITICDRWLDFDSFAIDVGLPPAGGKPSIDRIDNNGPYSPDNCRWSMNRAQCRNKRNNRRVTLDGATRTVTEWAEVLGISKGTIAYRIRCGWSPREALTRFSKRESYSTGQARHFQYQGRDMTATELSALCGVPATTISQRIRFGWSIEKAVATPTLQRGRYKKSA